MDSPPVPGELLVDIFLRIGQADLVRAAAACVSFRGLVADRSFLRQYCKLLSFIEVHGEFHRASPPHPSASAASAVALTADFSFSFLPAPAGEWIVLDIRDDGRVLLYRSYFEIPGAACKLEEIVVCDPLHRQYLLLPPIPDDVFTSVEKWHTFLAHLQSDIDGTSRRVKTFQLEMVSACAPKDRLLWPRAYSNFPPSCLSSATVASGKLHTYGYAFAGSMGGQLFLQNTGECFSLDVKTFQLEMVSVCASEDRLLWPRAYSNFPPSFLSLPTVGSGVENRAEKVMLEQGYAASSSAESPLSE